MLEKQTLFLNIEKTKCMVTSNAGKKTDFTIDGARIEQVWAYKNLLAWGTE